MTNISYKVSSEQWLEGWEKYYDTFKFKGQVIRAAIFLVPLILFVEQVIKDPSYGTGWVCIGICILCMAVLLLAKFSEKRNYKKLLESSVTDVFSLTVDGSEMTLITMEPAEDKAENSDTVGQFEIKGKTEAELLISGETMEETMDVGVPNLPPMRYDLSDKFAKAFESDKFFGIFSDCLSCVIPKSELSDEEAASLREALRQAMDKRFVLC